MDQGLTVVIGMSISYLASFLGMWFAYLSYRKRSPAPQKQIHG